VCGRGSICVNDMLECRALECIVVEEQSLWGFWVRMIRLQVGLLASDCPELATEFQFLWFGCRAGHSVVEKCLVSVVDGLGF
jgi:hypothetical protein